MAQQIIELTSNGYGELSRYIAQSGIRKILLVCDGSIEFLNINRFFQAMGDRIVRFCEFQPNPLYTSVVEGVALFRREQCDAVFAVGGGSAMDVAKCIKLYANMDHTRNYLNQEVVSNDIPLLALPTTAGTGSEATRYAVIYYQGEKQSVTHDSIVPSVVVFDPSVLTTLPLYQKKATLMDALCHGIESFWSVNATPQSKVYSKEAIGLIMSNWAAYIAGDEEKNRVMLHAANIAGKAINITQTTAGHAMCYKLTSLYGIAHGHAAGLCVPALWEYMLLHPEDCMDSRGWAYVEETFGEIAAAMGCNNPAEAIATLRMLMAELGLSAPDTVGAEDVALLKNSVNPVRLKNNPVALCPEGIESIYCKIFEGARK